MLVLLFRGVGVGVGVVEVI